MEGETKVLFVKNLSYSTTKESLEDAFEDCVCARIAKFSDTGKPRGFGFVEFETAERCKFAHDAMQGAEVDGREIEVDYTSELSSPAGKFGGRGGGTPRRGRWRDDWGGRGGRDDWGGRGGRDDWGGRGGGRDDWGGRGGRDDWGGRGRRDDWGGRGAVAGETKVLFVKNLSYSTTKENLEDAFEDCKCARIATFKDSGKPRGFGFVEFETAERCTSAHDAMQGAEVDGREIVVDYASELPSPGKFGGRGGGTPRGDRGRDDWGGKGAVAGETKVLLVKNLPYSTTKEGLEDAFEDCVSARIAKFSDTGKPRGFGFVEFETVERCKSAHDAMQGAEVDGREVVLAYASELSSPPGKFGGRGGGTPRGGRGRGDWGGKGGRW